MSGQVVTGSVIIASSTIGLKEFVGHNGSYLAILADDPEEFDRLAELALNAAKQMRAQEHHDALIAAITNTSAPAASGPASQAVTGAVAELTAAAPVARTVDIGMCRCGHPVGEHDTDGNGFCTGSVGWDATHADYLACDCKSYVAAGGAS